MPCLLRAGRRPRPLLRGLLLPLGRAFSGLCLGLWLLACGAAPRPAQIVNVAAVVETTPVPSWGDAADDPAIWVHPSDPALSVVIATDKKSGIAVYDLSGAQLQFRAAARVNEFETPTSGFYCLTSLLRPPV